MCGHAVSAIIAADFARSGPGHAGPADAGSSDVGPGNPGLAGAETFASRPLAQPVPLRVLAALAQDGGAEDSAAQGSAAQGSAAQDSAGPPQ
jgi:hypothetical protein